MKQSQSVIAQKGGSTIPEFIVAIDHITYYAVRAENEMTAIDLVLEGQGFEIHSETRNAYISDSQSIELHRNASAQSGPSHRPLFL
jgi:hypothetical protein